jgi:hypothetical protein
MQIDPIVCSQCGAPLPVPEGVGFVTCGHCHVALAVRRETDVIYTEVIEKLDRKTDHLAEEVAQLRYSQAIADIDRHWEREKEQYLHRGDNGKTSAPSTYLTPIPAVMAAFLVFAMFASSNGRSWPISLVIVIIGAAVSFFTYVKAQSYEQAESSYRRRRAKVRLENFRPK